MYWVASIAYLPWKYVAGNHLHISAGNNFIHARARRILLYRDVAQLVARTAGGREAAGSSPVIPTTIVIIMSLELQ